MLRGVEPPHESSRGGRRYAEAFPKARLHIRRNGENRDAGRATHFLMSDAPGEFAETVKAFLKQLDLPI